MSWQATEFVFGHTRSRRSARLVALALAKHAHADGSESFPSVGTIATETGMTARSVQRALRWLEDAGEIRPTGRRPRGTVVYQIVGVPGEQLPLWLVPIDASKGVRRGIRFVTGGVTPVSPLGVTPVSPEPYLAKRQLSRTPSVPHKRGGNLRHISEALDRASEHQP